MGNANLLEHIRYNRHGLYLGVDMSGQRMDVIQKNRLEQT